MPRGGGVQTYIKTAGPRNEIDLDVSGHRIDISSWMDAFLAKASLGTLGSGASPISTASIIRVYLAFEAFCLDCPSKARSHVVSSKMMRLSSTSGRLAEFVRTKPTRISESERSRPVRSWRQSRPQWSREPQRHPSDITISSPTSSRLTRLTSQALHSFEEMAAVLQRVGTDSQNSFEDLSGVSPVSNRALRLQAGNISPADKAGGNGFKGHSGDSSALIEDEELENPYDLMIAMCEEDPVCSQ